MPNVNIRTAPFSAVLKTWKEGSFDISLIHTGKEHCLPGHICSMPRDEFIIHFVLTVLDSILPEVRPGSLTPDRCL